MSLCFIKFTLAVVCLLGLSVFEYRSLLAEDGRGVIHAALVNAESVRKCDVVVRLERLDDVGRDEYTKSVSLLRMRLDWDRQRILNLGRVEHEMVRDGASKRKQRTFAVAWDGKVASYGDPIGQRGENAKGIYSLLNSYRFPDLRLVGVRQFPMSFHAPDSALSFESFIGGILNSKSDYQSGPYPGDPSALQLRVESNADDERVLGHTYLWKTDRDRFTPLQHDVSIRWRGDGAIEKRRIRHETYQWEDRGGVFLPVEIVADELLSRDGENYICETTARLHWFSVNQTIDEKYFDQSALLNLETFEELLTADSEKAEELFR